jgi:hypothetical protein
VIVISYTPKRPRKVLCTTRDATTTPKQSAGVLADRYLWIPVIHILQCTDTDTEMEMEMEMAGLVLLCAYAATPHPLLRLADCPSASNRAALIVVLQSPELYSYLTASLPEPRRKPIGALFLQKDLVLRSMRSDFLVPSLKIAWISLLDSRVQSVICKYKTASCAQHSLP